MTLLLIVGLIIYSIGFLYGALVSLVYGGNNAAGDPPTNSTVLRGGLLWPLLFKRG